MVEFNNSLLAKVATKTLEKFQSLDKDGDGYVSREEFQNSILDTYNNNGKRLQGAHATGTTIGDVLAGQDARFKQFDTAKDSNSKGLDFDEFSAMYKKEIYDEVYSDSVRGKTPEPPAPSLTKPTAGVSTAGASPSDIKQEEAHSAVSPNSNAPVVDDGKFAGLKMQNL